MADSCANCKFVFQGSDSLYCRRNPPTGAFVYVPGPGQQPSLMVRGTFPPIRAEMWCGEYRRGMVLATPADERLMGAMEGRA